jgi:YD repeat-containing protein
MSDNKKAELMSSAQAAEQHFATDNILSGDCVACGCEVFIRYHYDDDTPVADADILLIDSNHKEIMGKTDKNGLCKVEDMGCGSMELLLGEGSENFEPTYVLANNPVLQANPEYATLAGEYFSLFTILRREGFVLYDKEDSNNNQVDADNTGMAGGMFTNIPDEYEPAYERFWQLNKHINNGTADLKFAVNKIHSSIAGQIAGKYQDNSALLLFAHIALGFIPFVGQAIDIYDLGDWGWQTYQEENLDNFHWAMGALIIVGFVPGLGDAIKKTGGAVLDAIKKADKAAIQKSMKIIRSLSNGNIVKFLSDFSGNIKTYSKKALALLDTIIAGLKKMLKEGGANNWVLKLTQDVFNGLVKAIESLRKKLEQIIDWLITQVDEFIGKVVTRKTGTAKPKGTAKVADNQNAGTAKTAKETQVAQAKKKKAEEANENAVSNQQLAKSEPVDMATGKVIEHRQDFALPGHLPCVLTRDYQSSGDVEPGLLGNWRCSWDMCLTINDGLVTFIDSDFSQGYFAQPVDGTPTTSALKPGWLLHQQQSLLILTSPTGLRYVFDHALGNKLLLSRILDTSDNAIGFFYDRGNLLWVQLGDNRGLHLTMHQQKITRIGLSQHPSQPGTELVTYQYNAQDQLTCVRAAKGRSFDYSYNKAGHMLRWQDLQQTWVEHDYDHQGRAIATRCADGYWCDKIEYDDDQLITYYHNAFGGKQAYHRDPKNRIIAEVDPQGNRTEYTWHNEQLVHTLYADGSEIKAQFTSQGQLLSQTDAAGHTQSYAYDEHGHVTNYTNQTGDIWHYQHNAKGQLLRVTDPDDASWHYQYHNTGQCAQVSYPDGSSLDYIYCANGLLTRSAHNNSKGTGNKPSTYFDFEYDHHHRLCKRTDEQHQVRQWHYHSAKSQPQRITYEDGSTSQFTYDNEGNVLSSVDPQGSTHHYQYAAFDKLRRYTDP